jgi:hypothetical protein
MCYYTQKVHNYEILQMKTEFIKDEYKAIWFFYAKDIYGRPSTNKNTISTLEAKKQAKKLQQNKEVLRK